MASLESKIKKYSPNSAARIKELEDTEDASGKSAVENFKKGEYASAAKDTAKGLGAAAKNIMVEGPKAMFNAARNRAVYGEKPDEMKKGGVVKSSASRRADGCAVKGKTKGRMV
jgi:hypothetical protein